MKDNRYSGRIYVNKNEFEAICLAEDYVKNLLEKCSADEDTEEGKEVLDSLQFTLEHLYKVMKKVIKS